MKEIVTAQNLTFKYTDDDFLALDDLSCNIKEGELTAVLGHNGSGKSTFAKHINAILLPTGGKCYVDGIDTSDDDRLYDIRRTAGMVFQNPDNQIVATVCEEDVAFGLENTGVEPKEIRERVDKALKDVGMFDYRLHAPHQLSGGQKQRIAIAGIIAMRPKIIILDEPTAMLDPKGRKEVMDTIIRLNKEFKVTIILITHYMDEAALCDRIVVMDNGRKILDNTPKKVFSDVALLRKTGLDVPQVTELIYDLNQEGIDLPKDIIHEEECACVLYDHIKDHMAKTPAPKMQERKAKDYSDEKVIEVENLSYVYSPGTPFAKTAVDNVSFSINKGEFLTVIGHTGSGKSTLIQHLNGLIKPTSGRVLIDGEDIWENPKDIRKTRFKVGLVFQYPEYQLFEETVYRDIAFGPKNMGLSDEEIKSRVLEAASFLGLPSNIMDKSPFELSGGQKRRVAIAGVLAMRPEVLILDEPTAGLDPMGRETVFGQIKNYHKETGSTVILVSHSMEDVARLANRVMVINDSKIFALGSVDEVFKRHEELKEMGLSVPQITKVFDILRDKGIDTSDNIFTVEDAKKEVLRLIGRGEGKNA